MCGPGQLPGGRAGGFASAADALAQAAAALAFVARADAASLPTAVQADLLRGCSPGSWASRMTGTGGPGRG
jgi:hypothetical protein